MSLFPAYQAGDTVQKEIAETPDWLKIKSFQQFQESTGISSNGDEAKKARKDKKKKMKSEKKSRSRSSSQSRSRSASRHKVKKQKQSRSRSKSKKKSKRRKSRSRSNKKSRKRSSSSSRSRSRESRRSRSRETRRSRSRSRSKDRNKKSRSEDRKRKSRSRERKKKSRSRDKKRSRSRNRRSRSRKRSKSRRTSLSRKRSRPRSRERTRKQDNSVGEGEVFRIDAKPDKTLKFTVGTYGQKIPSYKSKVRGILGLRRFERRELLEDFKRFHNKNFTKKFLKSKDVTHLDKDKLGVTLEDLVDNLRKEFIRIKDAEETLNTNRVEDNSMEDRIRTVYDANTQNYLQGVGGLDLETETSLEEHENPQVKLRRLEFNAKLREKPTNVQLWIEFIDFQDEILKESVFELDEDSLTRAAKKKRGEVLRAKAVTERKLAICRAAIQKNSRSIELAVKRLELSRDLLDSKTLDQQWKELIFVYPENIDLWKRYLLFVQTFYIRFSVGETVKAYRNAILKLRQQQAEYAEAGETQKLFELEHGILDILAQLVNLLLQSGHTEKGIAVYQGLLEFNLFAPDFSSPGGYDFQDKVSLLEPIWEAGSPRVGEEGAAGWTRELNRAQQPYSQTKPQLDEDWEDELLSSEATFQETWLAVELGREQRHWCPWRYTEDTPEDVDRLVDFDFICGFLVEFTRDETRFRLLLDLVALLGVRMEDKQFSSLSRSSAMEAYYNKDKMHSQNFHNQLKVLQDTVPTIRTEEHLAIFIHNIFLQCYSRFVEPYRTKCMLLWLEYEASVIRLNQGKAARELRKDLKKLVRCLLKEDRNNLDLVVKFAELEYQMEGYTSAQSLLETAILAANSNFLKQNTEEGFLSATLLYRAAVELELREIVNVQNQNRDNTNTKDDSIHRNRIQWLLVHIGCGKKFSPYTPEKNSLILSMLEGAQRNFEDWLMEDVANISCSNVFKLAPFVRHSIGDVVFFYAWLTQLSAGTGEAVRVVEGVRNRIPMKFSKPGRFNQLELTQSFLVESLDKLTLDILQFNSTFNIVEKVKLRTFYHYCIKRHSSSSYFQSKLVMVQDSTSIVNSIWQEILSSIQDPKRTNLPLIEEACAISLDKFMSVLDPDNPQDISALGYGFLYKLSNLLERCVSKPFLKNSPLIWRLLLWCVSIDSLRKESKVGCENLKVMLYRAIQDVPWCKALYLDTALYLGRIGELTKTKRREIVHSDGEQEEEQRFEYIPGTLDHINELLVEKEIRVRLPLQELEVLLEPP